MRYRGLLSRINNWIIYFLFTFVIAGIIVGTHLLVEYLRKEEIKRIELFATAMRYQQDDFITSPSTLELVLQISKSNTSIPVIITDKNKKPLGNHFMKNISEEVQKNPEKLNQLIQEMEKTYKPFQLKLPGGNQYVYFTNSPLLNYLQYSPILIGGFVLAFILFSFWFLRTIKKTDEGFLWAGLAKETAHQIGTPLSSMIGWIEILKLENAHSDGVVEISKDIQRLRTISERFSKIGSVPELNDLNLSETLKLNFEYLKNRISSKISFNLDLPTIDILIPHNQILLSWVIENLVKNAVDAMKGVGILHIILYEKNKFVYIDFKDTGSGINKRNLSNIFKPGFSTKKRGWGLGLSLAKRVMKEYHEADIKVAQTELNKGSTFRISMKMIE